jgi:hypothetical protein
VQRTIGSAVAAAIQPIAYFGEAEQGFRLKPNKVFAE